MWIVITGAPSSGKTTLLHALRDRGFNVSSESAREILSQGGLDESGADVQALIEQRQIAKELALPRDQRIVFDRALPDSLAYRRLVGMDAGDLRALVEPERYAVVFLCAFGEHVADGIRKDDRDRALQIEALLREAYEELGCEVVDLPWDTSLGMQASVEQRLGIIDAWLLENA